MVKDSSGLEVQLFSWFQHSGLRCPGVPQDNQIRIAGEETLVSASLMLSQPFDQALKMRTAALKNELGLQLRGNYSLRMLVSE